MEASHYLHAARAKFHRRVGELPAVATAYARAAELTGNAVERAWLLRRRFELLAGQDDSK